MTKFLIFCLGALAASCTGSPSFPDTALDYCAAQVRRTLAELPASDCTLTPRNIAPDSTRWHLNRVCKEEWTAGFWPGVLWYDYEYTGDTTVRNAARRYTEALEFLSHTPAYDHDLGFLVFCSYGNAYRLTQDDRYREVILRTADTLATLFNPRVGTILSWPREIPALGGHNTIMDNMINLEMLFWAAENGGDSRLADIARSHADKTMQYNFRPDGSSYHVAVYDPENGGHLLSRTHQGYSDTSMWARGQAWGIYGFTMCYRFTHDTRYLEFARKITDLYLKRLPDDGIPYWDFDDPAIPAAPRDASAAAVVASALLELSTYLGDEGTVYRTAAEKMLRELDRNYRGGTRCPALLVHSTGHHPAGSEIDYAIIYADYYYYEALLRLRRLNRGEGLF